MVKSDDPTINLFVFLPSELELMGIDKGKSWLIGDKFFEQYYSIWDAENYRVGLIEANPNQGYLNNHSLLAIWLIVLGVLMSVIAVSFFCYRRYLQKKKESVAIKVDGAYEGLTHS